MKAINNENHTVIGIVYKNCHCSTHKWMNYWRIWNLTLNIHRSNNSNSKNVNLKMIRWPCDIFFDWKKKTNLYSDNIFIDDNIYIESMKNRMTSFIKSGNMKNSIKNISLSSARKWIRLNRTFNTFMICVHDSANTTGWILYIKWPINSIEISDYVCSRFNATTNKPVLSRTQWNLCTARKSGDFIKPKFIDWTAIRFHAFGQTKTQSFIIIIIISWYLFLSISVFGHMDKFNDENALRATKSRFDSQLCH